MGPAVVCAVVLAFATACTKPNPAYCDEATPCATGMCDLASHTCEDFPDGGEGPDARPDASGPCQLAGGQIVFDTDRDGDEDVAIMLADGSGYQHLTSNSWPDQAPQLSPDGSKIAWLSYPTATNELRVMEHDGSDQHDVSAGAASSPRWSPDGSRLVFSAFRGGNNEIYVVAADGSGLTNLTTNSAADTQPDWSSDGSRIVFRSDRDGAPTELYTMDADGTNQLRITDRPDQSASPRWSPTGAAIAWSYGNPGPTLWTMTPNGASPMMIASDSPSGLEWSPDGSHLVYAASLDIFTVAASGGPKTNLTNDMASSSNPGWSPDGSRLVFRTLRDGNLEVYSMNADGTSPTNLSSDPGVDVPGSWSRCP